VCVQKRRKPWRGDTQTYDTLIKTTASLISRPSFWLIGFMANIITFNSFYNLLTLHLLCRERIIDHSDIWPPLRPTSASSARGNDIWSPGNLVTRTFGHFSDQKSLLAADSQPNYIVNTQYIALYKPKFHLAPHVTSRLDTFDASIKSRRACRARRAVLVPTSNMADDKQSVVLACKSLVVFKHLHTQILFVPSNEIN